MRPPETLRLTHAVCNCLRGAYVRLLGAGVEQTLIERLVGRLRRDPTDREVAFIVSVLARRPRVLYAPERERLRRLAGRSSTAREQLLAEAAEHLLGDSGWSSVPGAAPSTGTDGSAE